MKHSLKIAIAVIIFGTVLYPLSQSVKTGFETIFRYTSDTVNGAIAEIHSFFYVPCREPITYSLGVFDDQFGISKEYFLKALASAEAVWEKSFGKELFTYEPENGSLKINLIYDYRQQATSKLENLGSMAKNDRASYDALKTKFVVLKNQYEQAKNEYDTQVQGFNDKNQAYQKQVEYWNARGGASKPQYDELQISGLALHAKALQLQAMQDQLNAMGDNINTLVVNLNRIAHSLNLTAENYNTIGASRGESFEEGLYRESGGNQEIDVYEFSNEAKLIRLLAHEFGHAVGLGHVSDPKAIMYELNQGDSETLTEADLTVLKVQCRVK